MHLRRYDSRFLIVGFALLFAPAAQGNMIVDLSDEVSAILPKQAPTPQCTEAAYENQSPSACDTLSWAWALRNLLNKPRTVASLGPARNTSLLPYVVFAREVLLRTTHGQQLSFDESSNERGPSFGVLSDRRAPPASR